MAVDSLNNKTLVEKNDGKSDVAIRCGIRDALKSQINFQNYVDVRATSKSIEARQLFQEWADVTYKVFRVLQLDTHDLVDFLDHIFLPLQAYKIESSFFERFDERFFQNEVSALVEGLLKLDQNTSNISSYDLFYSSVKNDWRAVDFGDRIRAVKFYFRQALISVVRLKKELDEKVSSIVGQRPNTNVTSEYWLGLAGWVTEKMGNVKQLPLVKLKQHEYSSNGARLRFTPNRYVVFTLHVFGVTMLEATLRKSLSKERREDSEPMSTVSHRYDQFLVRSEAIADINSILPYACHM